MACLDLAFFPRPGDRDCLAVVFGFFSFADAGTLFARGAESCFRLSFGREAEEDELDEEEVSTRAGTEFDKHEEEDDDDGDACTAPDDSSLRWSVGLFSDSFRPSLTLAGDT
jgi:hypothetical protein